MNHAYRLIWNELTRSWVAVAEFVRARGKSGRRAAVVLLAALSAHAHALPTGGVVSAGSGSVTTAGNTLTVTQASQNLAINWQSFNVGAGETANFVQPNASAIALNRVLGTDGSQILGKLNANGQVWILNPNGVLFGKGAQVNVGGLVASTLNISDADFMAGKRSFSGNGGTVTNQGEIAANYVALLGEQVKNEGVIVASLGTVAMAAGNKVTLDFDGDKLLNVQIDEGALKALADNRGLVQADGGLVVMTAKAKDALLDTAVNNTGIVRARTIENREGKILLLGDMDSGTVNVGGTLDASAPDTGDGGFVETSAAHVKIADGVKVSTKAATGKTGAWLIDPYDFTIAASGGDITGAALTAALGSTDVTIQTTDTAASCTGATCGTGNSSGNGDIFVNDSVTWSSHLLTLSAHRNIDINAALYGSGTAGLALQYGQGAVAAGNTADYNVNAPVNLASTGSFSTKLGSDGVVTNYTIITTLGAEGSVTGTDLQGMNGNKNGNYVLGADIDASATSGWNDNGAGGFYGFAPVGTTGVGQAFTGSFDGLGHSIDGLYINRPTTDYVGLFGYTNAATLRNVGLTAPNVTGHNGIGALAGYIENTTSVSASHAEGGSVTGTGFEIGGLIGKLNSTTDTVSGSYASSTVTSTSAGNDYLGGLVGYSRGAIANSYATGAVNGTGSYVGGLAGAVASASATISNSYATGAVSGNANVGGLAGAVSFAGATISNSYATGAVSGNASVGGLVGANAGSVTASYWNGDVEATGVGANTGTFTAVGKTTAEMKSLATFAGWDIDDAGGTGKVWRIYDGYTNPLLRGFLTALNVQPTYDGSGAALTNIGAVTPVGAHDAGKVFTGSLHADTLTLSSTAVDAYTATSTANNLYSNQQGYDLVSVARSVSTPGSAAGDIALTNPISWTSGTLAINTTGTVTQTAAINGTGAAVFDLQAGTWNQVNAALPGFAAYDFRISGGSFVRALSGDGTAGTPYQLADIYGIQGMGSSGMLGLNYALANDVAASGTANWNAGAGFAPVGNGGTPFTGTFDGLGHTIAGLYINRPAISEVGLFGATNQATLLNIGLDATITGLDNVGGLVGNLRYGAVANSHVAGTVNGRDNVGGLIGYQNGFSAYSYVTGSYATSNVTGSNKVGGLVGQMVGHVSGSSANIADSYAAGSVSGTSDIGGLVGYGNAGNNYIRRSYATGAVTGGSNVGGLLGGGFASGAGTTSFWDTQTTGQATSAGGLWAVGKTTAEMKSLATFAGAGWDIDDEGFTGAVWRIYESHTAPLLRAFLTPLSVTANNATKTYDGLPYSGGNGVTYSIAPNANLLGTLTYGGSAQGAVDVDTYAIWPAGLYSNQQGYDIAYTDGTLTVNQAPLTVSANNASKTFDGTAWSGGNGVSYAGFVGGEDASVLGGTLAWGGTSQGAINVGSYTLTPSGLTAGNYAISFVDGTLTIASATPTVPTVPGAPVDGYSGAITATSGGTLGDGGGDTAAGTGSAPPTLLASANDAAPGLPGVPGFSIHLCGQNVPPGFAEQCK